MGDALRLQTNVPETIALAYTDGLTVSSKFGGDQVMFSLVDDRKLFLSPQVAKRITESGIQPRQPFTICKRETVTGNRRIVNFEVEAAPLAAAAPPAPAPARTYSDNGIHVVVSSAAAVPAPLAAPPAPPAAPAADSSATAIQFAGMAAIDAVLAVETYARQKGLTDFSFDGEQISKIWMTLYIDARKGGRA